MSTHTEPAPAVGDFATYIIGSDRYPVEIIEVTARTLTTRMATVERTAEADPDYDGYAEGRPQHWRAAPNPHGRVDVYTLRKSGQWVQRGRRADGFSGLALGMVDTYRDPSF